MVPIAARPMMEHIIALLHQHHFTEVMATLFYLPESIQNHFGDGQHFGINIRYAIEETPLGTAGSVRNGADFLDETFLVISGDTLTDIDLGAAVAFHREKGATATLILTKVNNPLEYGVVITDGEGRIQRFLEKPGWGEVFSDTVNTGIYILEPKIFNEYQVGQVFDFSKDLFPLLLSKGEPLYGYVAEGYWSDIGNLEQYRQAHYDILNGKVQLTMPGQEIQPGVWVGENIKIDPAARISGPVLLGDYSEIGPHTEIGEFCVVGDHCVVGEGSSIKRSIVWEHSFIGDNSEIRGAILGRNSFLKGKNALFEGAVLGEGVSLGQRAVVKPQVKVWPDKTVESGAVLNESLIWAKSGSRSLFGNSGISGTVNREVTPEFAAKLGAVFGAYLKPGNQIVVSSDDFRPARVLKRALVSGVLSVGVGVYDLGTMTTPMTRNALTALSARGGVHIRLNSGDPQGVNLEFFDAAGLNIDKNTERSLENAFFTEDFPRVGADSMGELTFVSKFMEPYLEGLFKAGVKQLLEKAEFHVIATYDGGVLSLILPRLLAETGCKVSELPSKAPVANQNRTFRDLLDTVDQVKAAIAERRADLGIIVDNNGERLIILDETGEVVKEEEITALISFLILKYQPQTAIPVPVTAPHFIEKLAEEFHGRVIRTKASPRSLMEKNLQEKLFPAADGRSTYHPQFDGLFCLVKILELLAREKISLASARALVPPVQRGYKEADCPWEQKGKVMRNLFEENRERQVEMTDGLKVFHPEGWALVLPDAEEPIFKIYSEANTMEEADALTDIYLNRIQELQVQ
jgi:mannose-1-phosphate guanylyltransferase/phosphomannomutase